MSRIPLTKFAGLVTAPGLLERNEASCIEALNWEFPAPGVVRKRRGIGKLAGNTGGPVWALLTSRLMGSNVLAHVGTTSAGTNLRYGDGTGALASLSVVDGGALTRNPSPLQTGTRMHMALCQRNHYCTADEGIARVESSFGTVRYAGMPRGQGLVAVAVQAGTANPLADGYARAYRVTWHRKDADGVELGGAPTSRFVVSNRSYTGGHTGAARAAVLSFQIPWEFGTDATVLTTSYFWRLWGTHTYAEATQLGDDEMFLVSEAFLTAGDIATGYVASFVDDTPDEFLLSSPRLHTNLSNFPPGEKGLLQGVANEDAPPPVANDVAYWQDCMWFADYAHRARLTLSLISNFADGDTVTFTGPNGVVTLTAKTVVGAATHFQIFTTGPTTAINLRETVRAMIFTLNRQSLAGGASITGYTVGTSSTLPGLFYLEACKPVVAGATAFTSSVPARFQTTEGYVLAADAPLGTATNGLMFSKPVRADAVPPVNGLSIGSADNRILRIIPFKQRLLVFTDQGIFQVTGSTFASFSVREFDLGFRLMGRELVAMCDEKVYAWCNEGIVEVDDGGVTVISTPIEPTIEAALVSCGGAVSQPLSIGRVGFGWFGFAVAYRNQHQVRFHYPGVTDVAATYGAYAWLSFDTRTRAWARGEFSQASIGGYRDARSCGVVRFDDDLLTYGSWSTGADTFLFLENRSYGAADFTDTTRAGVSSAVYSRLVFQYQVPDEEGEQHWQQTVINWDAEEISWRTLPTSIQLSHTTEKVSSGLQTVAVGEIVTRVETPQVARRGQRLALVLVHEIAEYVGFVGVSQGYRPGTKFARGVTP